MNKATKVSFFLTALDDLIGENDDILVEACGHAGTSYRLSKHERSIAGFQHFYATESPDCDPAHSRRQDHIAANLGQKITNQALAQVAKLSPSHFARGSKIHKALRPTAMS